MWMLIGPFDGETPGDVSVKKTKLLKPSYDYMLGRKDRPLSINIKKISRDHLVFQVGEYTAEDAENSEKRPGLKILNVGAANRRYQRGSDELTVDRAASVELQDGDVVKVLHDIPVTVKWEPVVCFSPPEQEGRPTLQECAKLGISLVWKPGLEVTHHLTPTYSLTAATATSLLAKAHFVKPDWLSTLLSIGGAIDPLSDFTHDFTLPLLQKYRPSFSPSLSSTLKNHRVWEPNEERTVVLNEYRFVFLGERGREVKEDYKELSKLGGATYECCAAQGGRKTLHNVLAKAESKGKQPALIADETSMLAALGQDEWNELVEEAASYELRFIPPERICRAVVHANPSYLNSSLSKAPSAAASQSTPDVILNTYPDEASAPTSVQLGAAPQPESRPAKHTLQRRLPVNASRATSRAPSVQLVSNSQAQVDNAGSPASEKPMLVEQSNNQHEGTTEPRRLVRRLARARTPPFGIGDDPALDSEVSVRSDEPKASALPSTQSRPKLKRRLLKPTGLAVPQESLSDQEVAVNEEAEPPLKKHKALFEETDPQKIAQSGMEEYTNMYTPNEDVTPTQDSSSRTAPLFSIPEESAELVPPQPQEEIQSLKRKTRDGSVEAEMNDVDAARDTKRSAFGSTNAVEPSQAPRTTSQIHTRPSKAPLSKTISKSAPSQSAASQGAATKEPDRDEAFLKAVASTKRGKKLEDTFDREFNNLRIAKPDLERDRDEEDWAVLDDFGDDGNMRGNFMVIVEMDVYKKDETPRDAMRVTGGRVDWEGRPNFKKFKQKATHDQRKPVQVVIDEDVYPPEVEPNLLQGIRTQISVTAYSATPTQGSPTKTPVGTAQASHRSESLMIDSDDEMSLPVVGKSQNSKSQGQAQLRAPSVQPHSVKQSQVRSRSKNVNTQLFLDSDTEEHNGANVRGAGRGLSEVQEEPEEGDQMAVDEDNDSVSATLPTIWHRTQRTQEVRATQTNNRKRNTVVLDDDSDDGFEGFKNKRARR